MWVDDSPDELFTPYPWPCYRWKLDTGISGEITLYSLERTDEHGVTRRKSHMALVRLGRGTRFRISVTGGGLQLTAEFGRARVSCAETAVVNDWISDETSRFAHLGEAKLEAYHYADIRPQSAPRRRRARRASPARGTG